MVSVNSLLFLFTTLAPYTERPENLPVTYPPTELDPENARFLSKDDDPIRLFPDKKCPPLEWYTCSSHCQRRCEKSWWPCPGWCVPGCECIPPLVRGPDGNCIFQDQCPNAITVPEFDESEEECEPDEEMSCYSHCEKNCTNYDQDIYCPIYCVKGCMCKEPKIRGPDGSCILPQDCPSSQHLTSGYPNCREDEMYTMCYAMCEDNCYSYDYPVPCPALCKSGCVCKGPLVREVDGRCVFPNECRKRSIEECRDDEVFSPNGTSCIQTCDNYAEELNVCFPIATPNCYCPSLKVRGPGGKCIHYLKCPNSDTLVKRCSNPEECSENEEHEYSNTLLEPLEQFSNCSGENEVWSVCPPRCPDDCYNYENTNRACKIVCLPFPNCVCRPGFVRGPNGECIEPEQCPKPENSDTYSEASLQSANNCSENEEYKICGSACPKDCYSFQGLPCPSVCVSGCFCKEPMIRGLDGNCIHKDECPKDLRARTGVNITCREDEEYKDCKTECNEHDNEESCACVPGCYCKAPLLRDRNGNCRSEESRESSSFQRTMISQALCPDDRIYLFCGSPCEKNCHNYDKDIPCVAMCAQGCFCRGSTVVGPDGKCISVEECPSNSSIFGLKATLRQGSLPHLPTLNCEENEEFSLCASVCPDNCNNYQTDRLCRKICMPGCKCKNGFVLGKEGTCIKIEQCTEQKIDDCTDDEYYDDCGSHCEINCYNHMNPNRTCEVKGCKKGCFCKSGLVRSADWRCIPPHACLI